MKIGRMKKAISALLALGMVLSYVPMPAAAEEVCAHHVHSESCGYVEGVACGHVHGENCGDVTVTQCTHVHGEDGCTYVPGTPAVFCHPEHNGDCGYTEETPCSVTHEDCGCVAEVPESGECSHGECTAESGCVTTVFVCAHTVCDESCGFVQAQECTFDAVACEQCNALADQPADWCGNPLCSQEDNAHAPACEHYVRTYESCKCVLSCQIEGLNDYCETCYFDGVEACTGGEEEISVFDDAGFNITDDGELTKYTGSATDVVIPDGVTSIRTYAFVGCTSLESLTIPGTVTTVSSYAFLDCTNLKRVTISGTVGDISNYVFNDCSGLEDLEISGSVGTIGRYTFHNCSGLKSITISGSVQVIGDGAFEACASLITVNVPCNWNNLYDFGTSVTLNKVHSGTATYTVNDDGTHTPDYTCCEDSTPVEHSFDEDGLCICGADNIDEYDLWIGGIRVTDGQLSGSGWSFKPDTNILTLENADIDGCGGISHDGGTAAIGSAMELKIVLIGNNTVSGGEFGLLVTDADLTISGEGSLTVTGDWDGIKTADGSVTISGGKVIAKGTASYGLYAAGEVTIKDSTVIFEGGNSGCGLCAYGDVVLDSDSHVKISHGNSATNVMPSAEIGWWRTSETAAFSNEEVEFDGFLEYLGAHHATVKGNDNDSTKHDVSCEHGVAFTEVHCGGTATCMAAAECAFCGEIYSDIDPNGHTFDGDEICANGCGTTCDHAATENGGCLCGYVPGGHCGDDLIWYFRNGTMTISGTGDMHNYFQDMMDPPWGSDNGEIIRLIIEEGVTSVGNHAFLHAYNLEEVTLPASLNSIGDAAFTFCDNLKTVNVPCDWDGSMYDFGDKAKLAEHVYEDGVCGNCGQECLHGTDVRYTVSGAVLTQNCADCQENLGSWTVTAPVDLVYNGKAKPAAVTGSVTGVQTPAITYTKDGAAITGSPVNAGTYVASICVPDPSANNNAVTASVEYTIAKATAQAVSISDQTHLLGCETANTVDLAENLPADRGTTTYTLVNPDRSFFKAIAVDNGVLSYTTSKTNTSVKTTQVKVKVEMQNYRDLELTVQVNLQDTASADTKQQIVRSQLTAVPEGLKDTDYSTLAAVKEKQNQTLVTAMGKTPDGTAHYDVKLQFSLDGETWVDATPENFPKDGLLVTLPYPAGTGKNTHNFAVSHMFTTGAKAGTTETPAVTKTDSGIQFTVTGLSPISVAWTAIVYDVKIADTVNGTVKTDVSVAAAGTGVTVTATPKPGYRLSTLTVRDAAGNYVSLGAVNDNAYLFRMPASDVTVTATFVSNVTSAADTTNPKTGDDFHLAFWSGMMLTTLLGAAALLLNKKKFFV